jgi:hypothetical protein
MPAASRLTNVVGLNQMSMSVRDGICIPEDVATIIDMTREDPINRIT